MIYFASIRHVLTMENKENQILKPGTRVYNSGKISGLPRYEMIAKFEEHDEQIQELGYRAVNPLKSWIPRFAPWCIHMIADLALLTTCKAIYLQGDWIYSKGARIEKRVAEKLGKIVLFENDILNAKNLNDAEERGKAFRELFLKSVKIRFKDTRSEEGRKKIARIMEIAKEYGVRWRDSVSDPNEISENFPYNGLLYIWEDPTNGRLFFAHGGSERYFEEDRNEKEVSPDYFLQAYESVTKGL